MTGWFCYVVLLYIAPPSINSTQLSTLSLCTGIYKENKETYTHHTHTTPLPRSRVL